MNKIRRRYTHLRGRVVLPVKVVTRASKTEIVQILGDGTVKLRLAAPPVEGKANRALISFLAEVLVIAPSNIAIISGVTNRNKLIEILDLEENVVRERLKRSLS